MYSYLLVLVICASAGLQGWMALFTNFAKEIVGVNGFQIGVAQAVREIPGFLTFAVMYLLLVLREHRLSAWSVVLLGIGIGATGFFTTFPGLLLTTVLMSIGFHYFETTNKSLTVQYFNKHDAPIVFGLTSFTLDRDNHASGAVRIVTTDVSSATSVDEWMAGQLDGRVSLRPGGGDQVPAMLTTVPLGRDIASAGVRA